jgi:hypothetical protein
MKAENVKAVITGMRWFNDEVEGQRYDFTKIFVEEDLSESENSRGKASQEYEIGPSSEHLKYDGFTLPMEVKGDLNVTTNGKGRSKTTFRIREVLNQPQQKKVA